MSGFRFHSARKHHSLVSMTKCSVHGENSVQIDGKYCINV